MKLLTLRKESVMNTNEIFRTVGMVVCWGIAILLGLIVFVTLGEALIAFASTGIGAIVLLIVCLKLWNDWKER